MRLLNLNQASHSDSDQVFRTPVLSSLILMIVLGAIILGGAYMLIQGSFKQYDISIWVVVAVLLFLMLFSQLARSRWRAARRPSNWLLRITDSSVQIKYRSYENWRLNEDDPQVIDLRREEIAFVRKVAQRQISRDMNNQGVQADNRVELEIGLVNPDNAAVLEKALAEERARPGWGSDRCRSKWLDYPVQIVEPASIRITWKSQSTSTKPGIKRALEELGKITSVQESQREIADLTPSSLKDLPAAEQKKRLRDLALTDPLSAIAAVRTLYHCSLADARQHVEALAGKSDLDSITTPGSANNNS